MTYYAIYNTKTEELSKAQCKCLNAECINVEISKEVFEEFDKYIYKDGVIIYDVEYDIKKEAEKQQRIALLNLTGADVERGIYKATGKDFEDIIELVTQLQPVGLDIKALKIELKANNFYRGNPYVDSVGALLGFTKEQLDQFFETNDYTKLIAP